MEELIEVRKKGQVTLPLSMRKALRIEEGSVLMSKIVDDATAEPAGGSPGDLAAYLKTDYERWEKRGEGVRHSRRLEENGQD